MSARRTPNQGGRRAISAALLFYSERGILYYSTPREESFTILLRERNPLLFYSERGILYYSTPRPPHEARARRKGHIFTDTFLYSSYLLYSYTHTLFLKTNVSCFLFTDAGTSSPPAN